MNIIPKLQNGGGMPPFTYYRPVTIADNSASGATGSSDSTKSGNSKSELGIKDLLSMLDKIEGLPSDMTMLRNSLTEFLDMTAMTGRELDTSTLASQYVQYLTAVKNANFNKKMYDEAYDVVNKNNSFGEIAITNRGYVVVKDPESGEPKMISPDEYLNNKNKYYVLTNLDLLQQRAYNTPFSNTALDIVKNGTSMEEINKLIKNAMGSLGTNDMSQSGYVYGDQKNIKEGIALLQQIHQQQGVDLLSTSLTGLYKDKLITKTQAQQAQQAINYIYGMLPTNAKTLLKVKTGSEENSKKLIASFVSSGLDTTIQFDQDLILDEEGKKVGAKGTSGSNDYKLGVAEQWYNGYGDKKGLVLNEGTNYALHLNSNVLPVVKKDGTPLGESTVSELFLSQFSGLFDKQNVSMNNEFIDMGSLNKIITDGDAYSVDMPIDLEAKRSGKIKPDLNLSENLEKFNEYIRTNNIINPEDINKVCELFGLPLKYTGDKLNISNWKRFAVFNATAHSKAFKSDVTFTDYMREVLDDNLIENYKNVFAKVEGITPDKYKFDQISGWDRLVGGGQSWYSTHDSFYEGTLYIPINENTFNANAGTGNDIKPEQALTIEALEQQKQRISTYNNPGSFSI